MTSYEITRAGLKNQITIVLFKIRPTNRFSKAKSYSFHFHKNYVTWPLSANGLLGLISCYPARDTLQHVVKAWWKVAWQKAGKHCQFSLSGINTTRVHLFLLSLLKWKSRNITKHLMSGPSGNQLVLFSLDFWCSCRETSGLSGKQTVSLGILH